ncbi:MAG: T9SS type A sorting domain-containing protein [Flavobacteriales bacterium]|nr:MAG: T9SS type A sorting domain-containing protein [Flavobacteriales bacterium]
MHLLVRHLTLAAFWAIAINGLHAQTIEDQWWVPNGPVNAIVRDSISGTVYLGGDFTAVGAPARFGAWLDPVTGTPDLSWAQPNGSVINGIPDGTGGWFICGSFTQVGGLPRTRVARLASTGSVTAFNVDIPSGTVRRLLLSGDTLYMGGDFTAANNQRNLLAVNASTGAFLDLFPGGINGIVRALEKSGSTVWAGGNFTRTNGDGPKLSQLDKNSSITDWHFVKPAGGDVLCSAPDGAGGWYIGGTFTTVGGVARLRAARINADGTLHAWDPNVNADVNSIEVDGGNVYLGGTFTTVGGQARGRLAAVDAATGAVLPFFAGQSISPGFNVNDLVVNGSDLIVGGRFSFAGATEPYGAKLNITTGAADANYVNPGSPVYTSTPDGSGGWFIGGTFTQVNGVTRVGVARINADGTLNPWTATSNGNVLALHFDGSTLYMGGSFTTVGGQPRRLVAAVNGTTGAVLPFNANNVSGTSVLALHKEGSTLYVGGGFLDMGGTTRQNLAALDATSGAILPGWKQVTNAGVRALTGNGTDVFAGGEFTLTGLDRPSGTAVDPVTGEPDFSYLEPNSTIYAAIPDGSGGWYVGGSFDQIGFTSRSRIARINADGSVHPWNPGSNNIVRCLLLHGGVLYAGGDFTQLGGQTRNYIGALDVSSGTATAWNPNLNAAVLMLGTDGTNIVAGGSFTTMAGNYQPNYVSLNPATGLRAYDVGADGAVNAIKGDGTALYAGGAFTAMGRAIRNGAVMTTGSSSALPDVVMPNSEVHCSMPDGVGGWYIGGGFTAVNGVMRNYAARINADGTLHPWNPNGNSVVYSMALGAGVVYLGGQFTTIGGNTRNRIAAVDPTTGVATAWNPNANDMVLALVVDGSNVYAGGRFSTIGGQTRQKLAQLDATTGLASTWNANMASGTSAFVTGLELSGAGTLYVAGEFGSLGGAARIRAGEVSLTTALATSWAPSGFAGTTLCIRVNDANSVFIGQTGGPGITKWDRTTGAQITGWNALVSGSAVDIRVDAGVVYFGGQFTSAGGQVRHHAAALDASTAAPLPWNPMLNTFFLRTISIAGGNMFIGGSFTLVNVAFRNRLAELAPVTGAITTWNPNMNGSVLALDFDATTVYAGGAFTTVNGSTGRNRIAALDRATGTATSWSPNADSDVAALWKKDASTIYVGGYFNNIGGAVRSRLAEIDLSTGGATAWDPSPENGGFTHVKTVAYDGTRTYVGGQFQYMKAVTRNYAAAFDHATHTRTAWNPNGNNIVHALAMNGTRVVAGGEFLSFGGAVRNRVAEVNATTGTATAWDANANGIVNAVRASAGSVFLGGAFTNVGATERTRLAAVDGTTGALQAWDPGADATVRTLSIQGSDVFVGGDFQLTSGKPRSGLMAVDKSTSAITAWDPRVSSLNSIHQMFIDGGHLYVGGFFGSIKGISRSSLAAVDLVTGVPNSWNPGANSEVYTLTKQGSNVYCGGVFTTLAGQPRNNLGAVDATTGAIVAWNPAPNGVVRALATDGTNLFIGGVFTNLMATARNRAASVDLSSFTLNAWNPNADGEVSDIALLGNKALLTGVFNNIGGDTRNSLASWNVATGTINSFNPGANNDVHDLVINGSTLYVAGEFSNLSATTRNRIGAVNGTTGAITTWNPNASTTVTDIELAGSTMYACGPFTTIGGASRLRLAELNLASNTATTWNPGISGGAATPNRLTLTPTSVIVAGGFTTAGGQPRVNIAEVDRTTGLATGWNPDPNATLQTVVYDGTDVFAGGSFTIIGNQPRARLAALDATGALTAWNPGAGTTVRALALDANNVYVGGDFTTAGGQPRNRIAAIDRTTGTATAWNPNSNSAVHALHLSNGALYAGGTFSTIGVLPRLRIAQIDLSTGLATAWAPTITGTQVSAIQRSGNIVWLGGSFSDVNVTPRSNIASVDATTGTLTSFTSNAIGAVNALLVDGNDLYAGGTFTQIGGQARNRFAKLNATTGVVDASDALANNPALGMAHSGTKLITGGSFTSIGGAARERTAVLDKSTLGATGWDIGATSNNVNVVVTDGVRAYFGGLFTTFGGTTRANFGVATLCPSPVTYYRDSDGDGFGDPLASVQLCEQVPGVVTDNTDCNDTDAAQYPNAPCDDLNACTSPDAYDATCTCVGTPLPDGDGDGTCDAQDGCPADPLKTAPGQCGCGTPDTDTDGDLTADCNDGCAADPLKTAPGQCGCGVPDTDTDGDLTADCNDGCPTDPLKIAPGQCGCGVPDTDTDGDLTADCNDGCPTDPLKIAPGTCGCGTPDTDTDGDGLADCVDNCPTLFGQIGDACNDGLPLTANDSISVGCVCVGTYGLPVGYPSRPGSGIAMLMINPGQHIVVDHTPDINPGNGSFTVEFWVQDGPNTFGGPEKVLLSKKGNGGVGGGAGGSEPDGFRLVKENGSFLSYRIELTDENGVTRQTSSTGLTLNGIRHISMVYDAVANTAYFYLDGHLLSGSASMTLDQIDPSNPLIIGGEEATGAAGIINTWSGWMDELRIWNTALTVAEIRDHMCKKELSGHPQAAHLQAYYRFDEGAGTTLIDLAGQDNNGTVVNATPTSPWQTSPMPIGDISAHTYTGGSVTLIQGTSFTVNNITGATVGHVYRVNEKPNVTNFNFLTSADTSEYYGVYMSHTFAIPQASVSWDYTTNGLIDGSPGEASLKMSYRGGNQSLSWTSALPPGQVLNTGLNTISATPANLISGEYILGFHCPGSCDDGDPCTTGDAYNSTCACVSTPVPDTDGDGACDAIDGCPTDPLKTAPGACGCGVPDTDTDGDGLADCNDSCPLVLGQVGTPCDDGDPLTLNDQLNASCLCAGTCSDHPVALALATDANGPQTSWEIKVLGGAVVCSGSGYGNNGNFTENCCLPTGCYQLLVYDSFGDGMTTGGYVLRDGGNNRIIDNATDGTFGSVSTVLNGFCVPLGTDALQSTSCDLNGVFNNAVIYANPNPAVSAQYGVGNQTDDGYQYWFFDPDGPYSRTIFKSHANPGQPGTPSGPTACGSIRLNSIVTSPLPTGKLLNVRVRSRVNGVYAAYGPACRLFIANQTPACVSQLVPTPGVTFSCGATGKSVNGSDKIHATSVAGANRYQFEFQLPGSAYVRLISSATTALTLNNWATSPLVCSTRTYNVRVRASFDNGVTWCNYGPTCSVGITNNNPGCTPYVPNAPAASMDEAVSLTLSPNPVGNGRVNLQIMDLSSDTKDVVIDVVDLFGKQVIAQRIATGGAEEMSTVIELPTGIATGVYLVTVTAGNLRYVERLVVE